MLTTTLRAAALLVALAAIPRLHAEDCSAYAFPTDVSLTQRAIVTAPRTPFLRDFPNCPEDTAACTSKAYLVRGDPVFTLRTFGAFTCAAFVTETRQMTGWISTNTLTPAPWPKTTAHFSGSWRRLASNPHVASDLTFTRKGSAITADISATLAVRPDNVRTGGATGVLTLSLSPEGEPLATFANAGDEQCRVHLRPAGDLLLVSDEATPDSNSACGGIGVTLSGIYRRTRP